MLASDSKKTCTKEINNVWIGRLLCHN
uniref:Uncharacterized protein n=1 Tax=Pseudomonas phage KV2023 TaxID=3234047 RepID=A0AB39C6T4_9CAUD